MTEKNRASREIIVFLALTVILSTIAYIPIIQAGSISSGQSVLAGLLMLSPGLSAIITYLFFERNLHSIGWRPGKLQ